MRIILRMTVLFMLLCTINLHGRLVEIYQKNIDVTPKSKLDYLLEISYKNENLAMPYECSDTTFLRRAYLTFVGRIPTVLEVKSYLENHSINKSDELIDSLVESDEFNQYWSMHFWDYFRVKSEFPINLWPNAVYPYSKRITNFLANNESYKDFANSLILGTGSNFRNPEANFYRALSKKTPEGISEIVALTFMGVNFADLSKSEQASILSFFSNVRYKSTKEWKEEIVYVELPTAKLELRLPNNQKVTVNTNEDSRAIFAEYLLADNNPYFARAIVNRVWYHIFGLNFSEDPNNLLSELHSEEILNYLANDFVNNGYQIKDLCKKIGKSIAFKSSPFAKSEQDKSVKYFNSYKVQRIDAEIIDDNINKITHSVTNYSSVIPEPFTYLDSRDKTISIADGSLTSSFLIIFGRSVRDTGKTTDRNNLINAKQRQQMFNSTDIYRKISKITANRFLKNMTFYDRINYYYLSILSRYPMSEEEKIMAQYIRKSPKNQLNSVWILFNTQEFLYKF